MLRGYSSVVEPQPSKLMARVRSPLPAPAANAHIAQQVEHFLGKEEAIGSSPIVSTSPLEPRSQEDAAESRLGGDWDGQGKV